MNQHARTNLFSAALALLLLGGCSSGGKTAKKIDKGICEITAEDAKSSLSGAGWTVGQGSNSSSGENRNFTINFDDAGKNVGTVYWGKVAKVSPSGIASHYPKAVKPDAARSEGSCYVAIAADGNDSLAVEMVKAMTGK